VVAELPGFEFLKSELEEEASADIVEGDEQSASESKMDGERSYAISGTSDVTSRNSTVDMVVFRPDMPYAGANRIAFENHFLNHKIPKKSPVYEKLLHSVAKLTLKKVISKDSPKFSNSSKKKTKKKSPKQQKNSCKKKGNAKRKKRKAIQIYE